MTPPRSISSYRCVQVKAIRAEHGKKSFGPVLVDQVFGYVPPIPQPDISALIFFVLVRSGMRGLPAL